MNLASYLASNQANALLHTAAIGFDGFTDCIVKLVKRKGTAGGAPEYFNKMSDWGHYILSKSTGNFSAELEQRSIKTGGNMPNMATALSSLGIGVNCVGAMGYPVIDPLFSNMPGQCRLFSFAQPGFCQAIEFDDGKMMLAGMDDLNKTTWEIVKERIGISVLIQLFNESRLIGLLNWGELVNSTGYWNGLLNDVLPLCTDQNKIFFVDFSDCSSRTKKEMLEALQLMSAFFAYGKVIVSLNQNEAVFVYNSLFEPVDADTDIKIIAQQLAAELKFDVLLVHNRHRAIAVQNNIFTEKHSCIIESPKLITGAGDNFNAGFCFAQLMHCNLEDCLLTAHLVAAHYIKNGKCTSWDDLLNEIKKV